jgi:hypothetical protein
MKSASLLTLFLFPAVLAFAAEKIIAGPKGGRLLDTAPHRAEFFVNKDRKVEVTFYDAALKPVAPGAQVVAVTAEPKSGRTPVELTKTATGFVSSAALPAANEPYRIVVQIRAQPDSRPQNFRIDLNLEFCGECRKAEYACTCSH